MNPNIYQLASTQEYTNKIATIVRTVRQDAPRETTKPDGTPKDFHKLLGANIFQPKGVEVWWEGLDYPTKTFPYEETVLAVDSCKKLIMVYVRSFYYILQQSKLKALFLVLFYRKEFTYALELLIERLHRIFGKTRMLNKEEKYCRAVREVHRAFGDKNPMIRDIVCMILEYDDAYRYRFQDIMSNFDKHSFLEKDPIKELEAYLKMLSEKDPTMADKWNSFRKAVFLLRFKKDILKQMQDFVRELNLEEIKMDEADRYHASKKESYGFTFKGGLEAATTIGAHNPGSV